MQLELTFVAPPSPCGYLADRDWQLRYDIVSQISLEEYAERIASGWRRFGYALFRPECQNCQACLSLRVDVKRFRASATQKRVWKSNQNTVKLMIGEPSYTREKIDLYQRFHHFQADAKGWPEPGHDTSDNYIDSFVVNPVPTQEWCYYLHDELVGVGFVDQLPFGLSAIYFFYDPKYRQLSLGVFNVLSVLEQARRLDLPHVYLGYFVQGCQSLEYKAKYRPNEIYDYVANCWKLLTI